MDYNGRDEKETQETQETQEEFLLYTVKTRCLTICGKVLVKILSKN